MKKRLLIMIMGLIFILNTTNISVDAASNKPSSWAEEEVNKALEENMVPSSLRIGYTYNIKRYEYVLIALELLELNNDQVSIIRKYPFYDIYGHEYETEIVKAYNAGIINGNGDGTFRPDDPINRQEITALVVNLVKRLENISTVDTTNKYTYSDTEAISNWATPYINYCYNNKIMNGTGKDANGKDIIDPKGKATREQAIILLYRLANNAELFETIDLGTISVVSYPDDIGGSSSGQTSEASTVINDFAKVFGQTLAKEVISVSKLDNTEIVTLSKNYVQINFINEGTITISHDGYGVDMKLRLNDLSLANRITTYLDLARIVNDSEALEDAMYRDINVFGSDVSHGFNQSLSSNETYISFAETVEGVNWFDFSYQFNSN